MWMILRRAVVPLLLLTAGVSLGVYGAKRHVIPVIDEHEEEVSLPISAPFGFGLPGVQGEPFPGGPAFGEGQPPGEGSPMDMPPPPPWQPQPMTTKVMKKVILTTDEPESKIIREASVGGVAMVDGEIKRTYSGDQGPALCPT